MATEDISSALSNNTKKDWDMSWTCQKLDTSTNKQSAPINCIKGEKIASSSNKLLGSS